MLTATSTTLPSPQGLPVPNCLTPAVNCLSCDVSAERGMKKKRMPASRLPSALSIVSVKAMPDELRRPRVPVSCPSTSLRQPHVLVDHSTRVAPKIRNVGIRALYSATCHYIVVNPGAPVFRSDLVLRGRVKLVAFSAPQCRHQTRNSTASEPDQRES